MSVPVAVDHGAGPAETASWPSTSVAQLGVKKVPQAFLDLLLEAAGANWLASSSE